MSDFLTRSCCCMPDEHRFLLMDAYGLLPRHCYLGGRSSSRSGTSDRDTAAAAAAAAADGDDDDMAATQCALSREQVTRMLAAIKVWQLQVTAMLVTSCVAVPRRQRTQMPLFIHGDTHDCHTVPDDFRHEHQDV